MSVRALCEAIDDEVDAELDQQWTEAAILDQARFAGPQRVGASPGHSTATRAMTSHGLARDREPRQKPSAKTRIATVLILHLIMGCFCR